MKHNGYFAVVLDDTWTDVVRKNATMDVVRGDHITIAYKPDNTTFENLRDIIKKNKKLNIPMVIATSAVVGFGAGFGAYHLASK